RPTRPTNSSARLKTRSPKRAQCAHPRAPPPARWAASSLSHIGPKDRTMSDAPARDRVHLAVVGGRRGRSFHKTLDRLTDRLALTAVCDVNTQVLRDWQQQYPEARAYDRYEDLLEDDNVDAVLLATPLQLHARQAIAALEAGKHVLSEVIAANTLEECWELVEAVERTGGTYMMAENYCYMRPNLMVETIAERGLFGRVTHLEGAYVHDCRILYANPDG